MSRHWTGEEFLNSLSSLCWKLFFIPFAANPMTKWSKLHRVIWAKTASVSIWAMCMSNLHPRPAHLFLISSIWNSNKNKYKIEFDFILYYYSRIREWSTKIKSMKCRHCRICCHTLLRFRSLLHSFLASSTACTGRPCWNLLRLSLFTDSCSLQH